MMRPLDFLIFFVYSVLGVGVMLLLIRLCGQANGLQCTLLLFILQCGFLFARVINLERRLMEAKQLPMPGTRAE